MQWPVDVAQGGEPRESPRGLEHVERVLEPPRAEPRRGAAPHDEINEPGRIDVTSNVLGVIIEDAVIRDAVGCAD